MYWIVFVSGTYVICALYSVNKVKLQTHSLDIWWFLAWAGEHLLKDKWSLLSSAHDVHDLVPNEEKDAPTCSIDSFPVWKYAEVLHNQEDVSCEQTPAAGTGMTVSQQGEKSDVYFLIQGAKARMKNVSP